jgi:hypothetical protein
LSITTALPERSAAEQPEPGPETAGGPGSLSALNALTMLAVEHVMTTFYDNTADRVDPRAGLGCTRWPATSSRAASR